ncbi:hypothetical protein CN311_23090 [Mesorhizobium sanjuanii]|uniref:N-acetyltransferase domain-containing protein n=1 Tax=Mesorhizobium sanjuanii TaxID=2037900 RepID=A0A2A6F9W7_9HYPH|nr:hypothetical protein [Mesorhizobium sanjuanii]PDQ18729.1 hypothetical protein CN311_23090 [Mesorhizobium sanjuanii]
MKARTATVGDLEDVFRDLSKRMSDEYVAAGKDPKIAYDNLMMNLKEGRAHALVQDDKTVAIIAWHEHSDAAVTLFAAREDFFSAATIRFCKRHIRQIQALAGNLPIHSTSWLQGPDVARWFGIIGYVEREPVGGASLFELPPESSQRWVGQDEAAEDGNNVSAHRRTG